MLQPNHVSIKRVVSCFIMTSTQRVAVFHRQSTMPTFPSHWAPCSGSIESGEAPWETATREIAEETNLQVSASALQAGLYVDVPLPPRKNDLATQRVIRVYPFLVNLPTPDFDLELKGTEHDTFKFVTIQELEALQPAVPALATAFHHATRGLFLRHVPETIQAWRQDRENGASTLTVQALQLLQSAKDEAEQVQWAEQMRMMRPTMVAITNALNRVIDNQATPSLVMQQMKEETDWLVHYGCTVVLQKAQQSVKEGSTPFRIATFSRSSTIVAILNQVQKESTDQEVPIDIVCAESNPGGEGAFMAKDVNATCIADEELQQRIRQDGIDLVLVGADCLVSDKLVVNKVKTRVLAEVCAEYQVPIWCFTDSFKIWDDCFPPPLEDIFECIDRPLLQVISKGVADA